MGKIKMSKNAKPLAAALMLSVVAVPALAQLSAGPFTQAQVQAGRADYVANCAACHQDNLSGGGEAPSLAGGNFLRSWGGKSTRELYGYIHSAMPLGPWRQPFRHQLFQYRGLSSLRQRGACGTAPLTAASDVRISQIANGTPAAAPAARGAPVQRAAAALRANRWTVWASAWRGISPICAGDRCHAAQSAGRATG